MPLIVFYLGIGECARHGSGYVDLGRESIEFGWGESANVYAKFCIMKDCDEVTVLF